MNLAKFLDFFSSGQAERDQPYVPFTRTQQVVRAPFTDVARQDFGHSAENELRPMPLFSTATEERVSRFGEISTFQTATSIDLGNGTYMEML